MGSCLLKNAQSTPPVTLPATLAALDDSDLPVHELMVNKVHEHDALAGIQLVHNGLSVSNYLSRMPALPFCAPTETSN